MMPDSETDVHAKFEFLVDLNQPDEVNRLKTILSDRPEIRNANIDLSSKRLVLETSLQSSKVQQLVEQSLNTNAVLLGAGKQLGAAVSALYSNMNRPLERRVHGLVRFIQADDDRCIIEGTVDGLPPNEPVRINIHQYGDLSNGCENCGDYFNQNGNSNSPTGVLGQVMTDERGVTNFRFLNRFVRVADTIGRSFVVQRNDSQRVACGIIARSAGLFENTKRLCTCSGATVWQEREEAKEMFPSS